MKFLAFALLLLALALIVGAAGGSVPHAEAINGFFDEVLLVVMRLKGLIEPIVGLAVAAMIAMQAITMRRQKRSQDERAEQSSTLAAQNDQLAHISRQVETVKAAVAPPECPKE